MRPLLLALMVLLSAPLAQAQTVQPNPLNDLWGKVTINQGAMYTLKANSVSYTMTTDLVQGKGFLTGLNLIVGYSTAAKAIAGIDYDLMNLHGVNIPILKFVDVHVGWAASWDNIGGRNVIDNGPVVTIAQISF